MPSTQALFTYFCRSFYVCYTFKKDHFSDESRSEIQQQPSPNSDETRSRMLSLQSSSDSDKSSSKWSSSQSSAPRFDGEVKSFNQPNLSEVPPPQDSLNLSAVAVTTNESHESPQDSLNLSAAAVTTNESHESVVKLLVPSSPSSANSAGALSQDITTNIQQNSQDMTRNLQPDIQQNYFIDATSSHHVPEVIHVSNPIISIPLGEKDGVSANQHTVSNNKTASSSKEVPAEIHVSSPIIEQPLAKTDGSSSSQNTVANDQAVPQEIQVSHSPSEVFQEEMQLSGSAPRSSSPKDCVTVVVSSSGYYPEGNNGSSNTKKDCVFGFDVSHCTLINLFDIHFITCAYSTCIYRKLILQICLRRRLTHHW